MRLYLNGHGSAFEIVYERRREGLRRYFVRQTRSPELGSDLAQETWFKLLRACENGGYTAEAKFTTFLYKIGNNLFIDWFRKHGGNRAMAQEEDMDSVGNDEEFWGQSSPDPERQLAEKERDQAVQAAIGSLSPEQRETLLMQLEGDLSYDEIAEAMNTNRETVKTRLRYARAHLKKRLLGAA